MNDFLSRSATLERDLGTSGKNI